jgi:hypothetical protein
MNSHNRFDRDPLDSFIKRSLNTWLNHHYPPFDAKQKLLRTASYESLDDTGLFHFFHILLQQLYLRISSAIVIQQDESLYSPSSHYLPIINNGDFHSWRSHQILIRSFPSGRGTLGFLY